MNVVACEHTFIAALARSVIRGYTFSMVRLTDRVPLLNSDTPPRSEKNFHVYATRSLLRHQPREISAARNSGDKFYALLDCTRGSRTRSRSISRCIYDVGKKYPSARCDRNNPGILRKCLYASNSRVIALTGRAPVITLVIIHARENRDTSMPLVCRI